MPSDVRLLLKGLLVLSAKVGQGNGKVAVIKNHPQNHDLLIRVTKSTGGNPIERRRNQIQDLLSLNITNATTQLNTTPNTNPVDRKTMLPNPPEPTSFRWFVDLERPTELYKSSIGADSDELGPILEFNSGGQLLTAEVSRDFLKVQRGILANYEDFGRVALTLEVRFPGTTSAILMNGSRDELFNSNSEPNTNYKVEIIHDATTHGQIVTDANFYYTALGAGIDDKKRILFMSISQRRQLADQLKEAELIGDKELEKALKELLSRLGPPIGPEAACFPAYISQTNF